MKRRSFLQSSSFVSVPLLLNGMPVSAIGRNFFFDSFAADNDNVLVLIQLNGGNDGLNTIIPLDKYNILANVRSNVVVPENQVLTIEDNIGFHPNMGGLQSLYDDAKLTVVHDAGYPNQNRSHFRSTDIWTTGSPAEEFWTTGWLGRYFENRFPDFPVDYPNTENPDPFAITIGAGVTETCQGTLANFSLALADPFSLSPLAEGGGSQTPNTPYGKELDFLRIAIKQANAYGSTISEAAENGSNMSDMYGEFNLAQQLKTIALLISGGLQTKVYVANIGGFDTHANQVVDGETTTGGHATLVQNLSNAMQAFQDDLTLLGLEEKVITMTFSEFGRRIRSNDSLGTDHGTAAPLMVAGSCINPGFIGTTPDLPDNPSVQDGVPMQYDFRSIYGSILIDWFGVEETEVKSILYDDFTYIPIIKSCSTTTPTDEVPDVPVPPIEEVPTYNFPNPFSYSTTINFQSTGQHYKVSLFDSVGREIKVLTNQHIPKGNTEIKVNGSDLVPGNYFYRILSSDGVRTKAMVKV